MTKEYKVIGGGMYSGFVELPINEVPKQRVCDLCEDIFCYDTPNGRVAKVKGQGEARMSNKIEDCPIRKNILDDNEVEDFFNKNLLGS